MAHGVGLRSVSKGSVPPYYHALYLKGLKNWCRICC